MLRSPRRPPGPVAARPTKGFSLPGRSTMLVSAAILLLLVYVNPLSLGNGAQGRQPLVARGIEMQLSLAGPDGVFAEVSARADAEVAGSSALLAAVARVEDEQQEERDAAWPAAVGEEEDGVEGAEERSGLAATADEAADEAGEEEEEAAAADEGRGDGEEEAEGEEGAAAADDDDAEDGGATSASTAAEEEEEEQEEEGEEGDKNTVDTAASGDDADDAEWGDTAAGAAADEVGGQVAEQEAAAAGGEAAETAAGAAGRRRGGSATSQPAAGSELEAGGAATVPAAAGAAAAGAAAAGESLASSSHRTSLFNLPLSPFERALKGCADLACIKAAQEEPKHPGQFNFPHFYILGFPKCATTSLFHHLIQHPQIMAPRIKEPNFYTSRCQNDAVGCSLHEQNKYVTNTLHLDIALQARLWMAVFEGSTHYSLAGEWLAPQLKELMPWVKLVLSMRDPISRAISMLTHNMDHGRMPDCLDRRGLIYQCIREDMENEGRTYAPHLRAWVENFPREQLHIVQYENLIGPDMKRVLRDIKRFIGIDIKLPSDDLGLRNTRKADHADGWPMSQDEYNHLIKMARKEARQVTALISKHGFADAKEWMATWEQTWEDNLKRCRLGPMGEVCWIQLT